MLLPAGPVPHFVLGLQRVPPPHPPTFLGSLKSAPLPHFSTPPWDLGPEGGGEERVAFLGPLPGRTLRLCAPPHSVSRSRADPSALPPAPLLPAAGIMSFAPVLLRQWKLAVHYIRNANAAAPGRLARWVTLLLLHSSLPLGAAGRVGGFSGKTVLPPASPGLGSPQLLPAPPWPVGCPQAPADGGRRGMLRVCVVRVCAGCPAAAAPEQEAPDAGTAV